MSLSPFLRKVFLVDLFRGMGVTFRNQSEKERVTEQYPMERPEVYERFRGQPRLKVNPEVIAENARAYIYEGKLGLVS